MPPESPLGAPLNAVQVVPILLGDQVHCHTLQAEPRDRISKSYRAFWPWNTKKRPQNYRE